MRAEHTAWLVAAIWLGACGGDGPAPAPDAGGDVGADAGAQDVGEVDARVDAGAADGGADASDGGEPAEELLDPEVYNTPDEAFDAVNPFIGTGGGGYGFSALTPAAQVPLGMVRVGPDTTRAGMHGPTQHMGGYNDLDPDVRGFSHLHFVGTGVPDYGNLRVGAWREVTEPWWPWTANDKEYQDAEPGYYRTRLPDERVEVELAPTTRGAIHRYTFEPGGAAQITIDPGSSITDEAIGDATITYADGVVTGSLDHVRGYSTRRNPFTLHFVIEVSPAPDGVRGWSDRTITDGPGPHTGARSGLILDYTEAPAEPVVLRVGVSWNDAAGAQANFDGEVAGKTFEQVREEAKALWLAKLSKIRVAGGRERDREVFFTALYNAYRMPTRLDDVDGRYAGIDGEAHPGEGHAYYSDLSLWDSFRTTHPLYELIDEEVEVDVLRSLLLMARDGGYVPRWPAGQSYTGGMVGSSADMLFGGAAAKGLTGIDWSAALEAVLRTADQDPPEGAIFGGRGSMAEYTTLGYVPVDGDRETVSRTQEYAFADAGVAALARRAGDAEAEARFTARADSWRDVWDPETRFFRGKNADGTFGPTEEFSPEEYTERGGPEYTEGTAWHWRFYVPHDPDGLVEVFGGGEALVAELEEFFSRSGVATARPRTFLPDKFYWHGNQPSLHVGYLFAPAGAIERGAHWIDRVRELLYTPLPSGLPGNDDGGTLSSWYVFSALGFYPIAGSDRYIWGGAPVFSKAEVVAAREPFTVTSAPAAQGDRQAVDCARDGQALGVYVTHEELLGSAVACE